MYAAEIMPCHVKGDGGGWEAALTDAEQLLVATEKKRVRLKETIAAIKRKIEAGELWPGPVQESDRKRQANG